MDSLALGRAGTLANTLTRHHGPATERSSGAEGREVDLDILPGLLGYNVRLAQLALQRRFVRAMSGSDVGSGVFGLLVLCGANAGIAQIQVAQHLNIDKASVVSLVDRLEEQGWLLRRRSTRDRRRHGLFLTAEGERELVALKLRMRDCEQALDAVFDSEERRQLIRLLQRIRP
jgi:DNA-binding MarR family transcriptional regulator